MNSLAADAADGWQSGRIFATVTIAMLLGYVGALVLMLFQHRWILDSNGRPFLADFLAVWVVGQSVLSGAAATAYDWQIQHATQIAAVGHNLPEYLGWNYPPLYLFVAACLASFPFVLSYLSWVVSTGVAYAMVIGSIAKKRVAAIAACAAPMFLANAFPGQNGFLTAALMGGALLLLDRRPIVSGVLLGLMTYKPQFGILFPIVFALAGHWRTVASATVVALTGIAGSWVAFGSATYRAFFHFLPLSSHLLMTDQGAHWRQLQSAYGLARIFGAGDRLAWDAQGAAILACLGLTIWLWRRDGSSALRNAGLSAAALLATPYLHLYDFPVILVPLAFLFRDRRFDRLEWTVVIAINVVFAASIVAIAPIGSGLVLLVLALVLRRAGLWQVLTKAVRGSKSLGRLHAVQSDSARNSLS